VGILSNFQIFGILSPPQVYEFVSCPHYLFFLFSYCYHSSLDVNEQLVKLTDTFADELQGFLDLLKRVGLDHFGFCVSW